VRAKVRGGSPGGRSETTGGGPRGVGFDLIRSDVAYGIAATQMTSSDLQDHPPTASLCKCDFFLQLCRSWQDFNWHSASESPSAI